MKKIFCLLFLFIVGCSDGPQQLFETAELEMLQTNYPHATRLYQEIVTRHPDSELAEQARIRLRELQAIQAGKSGNDPR